MQTLGQFSLQTNKHCARRHGYDSWICLFLGVRTPRPGDVNQSKQVSLEACGLDAGGVRPRYCECEFEVSTDASPRRRGKPKGLSRFLHGSLLFASAFQAMLGLTALAHSASHGDDLSDHAHLDRRLSLHFAAQVIEHSVDVRWCIGIDDQLALGSLRGRP